MNETRPCAMAVMAKAPQPGRAKTRLIPPLTAAQAAALSAAFLRDVTENIVAASCDAPIQGFAAYAPAGTEALFDGVLAGGITLILADGAPTMPPGIEGFGRCLLQTIQTLLANGFGSAVVLNSDSPNLPTAILTRCAQLLAAPGDRAVLGPADDGGYYLLGLKSAHSHLLSDISWSTANVAQQTRERAREIGLELVELPVWYDVDDASGLERLMRDLLDSSPSLPAPYAAPATAACIAQLGLNIANWRHHA
jgi:rSAM/selenodomain-associated transferase 1